MLSNRFFAPLVGAFFLYGTLETGVARAQQPLAELNLSDKPTTSELSKVKLLPELFVPSGDPTSEDNAAFGAAIQAYVNSGSPLDMTPYVEFLSSNPNSKWSISLWTDLGLVYYKSGRFTSALDAWKHAWELGKGENSVAIRPVVDRALGEYAKMYARVGQYDQLDRIFKEVAGRKHLIGPASELMTAAKEGRATMEQYPGEAFRCGPLAVQSILLSQDRKRLIPAEIEELKSTKRGTSLVQVRNLTTKVGLNYQMAFREAGAGVIFPSVVHWKLGHYAAIIRREGEFYRIQDLTFGDEFSVTKETLDVESDGYFVVPSGQLLDGWRRVTDTEGKTVWGKGTVNTSDPDRTTCGDKKAGGTGGCNGMATYSMHLLDVSLNITDTPIPYVPAVGPSVGFTITYNQREANQATTFGYSNFGPKWTNDWVSYVIDDPTALLNPIKVYQRAGGAEQFNWVWDSNTSTWILARGVYSGATLNRVQTSPIKYTRTFADGSVETFSKSDGTTTMGRKVFLTEFKDARGNSIFFDYDSSSRIYQIRDAAGKTTTVAYELPSDPLKITKITDPFGRSASFEYTNGQLTKITDVVGIKSQFTYLTGTDFIQYLDTPYGRTTFDSSETVTSDRLMLRWLEAMDPLGGKERVEYDYEVGSIPNSELVVPAVLSVNGEDDSLPLGTGSDGYYDFHNANLSNRNSFFWSKKAMATAPGDYTAAHIYHWLHEQYLASAADGVLESEKAPLENRVWYKYRNQSNWLYSGDDAQPTVVARVLDNGTTTQAYMYEYNSLGNLTKQVGPAPYNRTQSYIYYPNGIDLKEVRQTTGSSNFLLASFGTYNSLHLPSTMTDAAAQTTTYGYNGQGQKTTETVVRNGQNETKTWGYTGNYLTSVTGPIAGSTTSCSYDGAGRGQTVADSAGYTVNFNYDNLDRLTKATYPDGSYQKILYTYLDPEWQRDRLGRWTHIEHDALRHVTAVTDPENRKTQYHWCTCGALESITDPNNYTTTFGRDIQSRIITKTYMDTSVVTYNYEDTTSRLHSVVEPKMFNGQNQRTTYGYKPDNSLDTITYTGAQYQAANVSFTYDSIYDRLESMTDGTGTTDFRYNAVGGLGANQLDYVDGPLANDRINYTYDELGHVLSVKVNGTGETVTYDALGRVITASNTLGSFGYFYVNQTPRLDHVTRPGSQTVNYSYFPNSGDERLSEIKNQGPASTLLSKFDYTYDALGNIKQWTQQAGTASANYYELAYDGADQLRTANFRASTNGALLTPYTYGYDAGGNRTSDQVDNVVRTGGYNNLNQLKTLAAGGAVTVEGNVSEPATMTLSGRPLLVDSTNHFRTTVQAVSGLNSFPITATDGSGNTTNKTLQVTLSSPSYSLDYDLNGNLTSDGVKTYEWDGANRLVAINYPSTGTRTEFTYDGMGRRVQIVEKTGTTVTSTKKFVWIGNRPAEERDGSNIVTKRFYGEGEQIGGTVYLFSKDHLGSIREMTDLSGTVRARYAYDPYGRRAKVSGDLEADFGYTGHYYHSPSALSLALYRAYDADKGRWLSRDPLDLAELLQGPNIYRYAGDSPMNFIDKDGRFILPLVGAALGGIANAITNYNKYAGGCMSGSDYANSIIFGAGVGALAGFAPGVGSAAFVGGLGAAANTLFNQSSTNNGTFNFGEAATQGLIGAVTGGTAGALEKVGGQIIRNAGSQIGKTIGRNGTGVFKDYGTVGGIIGDVLGTAVTTSPDGCPQ